MREKIKYTIVVVLVALGILFLVIMQWATTSASIAEPAKTFAPRMR